MGTRELESDVEDENAFEVPRESLMKFVGKAPPTKSQLKEAIEKVAKEQNYDLVLYQGVAYAGKKVDITATVIKALGSVK